MFNYKEKLANFIAHGNPSEDTLKHYTTEIDNFLDWTHGNGYDPLTITENDARDYLSFLVNKKYATASINLKISAVKMFYFAALKLHAVNLNPFEDIKFKAPSYDDADFDFLNVDEIAQICDRFNHSDNLADLRDLSIIMLMSVEGLRTVEVHRMSDEDFNYRNNSILIHGKGRDSYIYPCQDTLDIIKRYLDKRGNSAIKDDLGTPTFIGFSKKFYGVRISRNGIRWSINNILIKAGKKKDGASCHMLRHSCGTNLYAETKDLRLVQETLRQKDPATTARYAHVQKRIEERKTATISPLKEY